MTQMAVDATGLDCRATVPVARSTGRRLVLKARWEGILYIDSDHRATANQLRL